MNSKHLFKGGLIALGIYTVGSIFLIVLFKYCSAGLTGADGFLCSFLVLPAFFPAMPFLGGYSGNLLRSEISIFLFNGFFWFIIGVLIRYFYLKVKSNNK